MPRREGAGPTRTLPLAEAGAIDLDLEPIRG
jgi:hypothetical protein